MKRWDLEVHPYLCMTSELNQPGSKGTPASAPQGVNLRGTHRIVCLESQLSRSAMH